MHNVLLRKCKYVDSAGTFSLECHEQEHMEEQAISQREDTVTQGSKATGVREMDWVGEIGKTNKLITVLARLHYDIAQTFSVGVSVFNFPINSAQIAQTYLFLKDN